MSKVELACAMVKSRLLFIIFLKLKYTCIIKQNEAAVSIAVVL